MKGGASTRRFFRIALGPGRRAGKRARSRCSCPAHPRTKSTRTPSTRAGLSSRCAICSPSGASASQDPRRRHRPGVARGRGPRRRHDRQLPAQASSAEARHLPAGGARSRARAEAARLAARGEHRQEPRLRPRSLRWEIDHFLEWGVVARGIAISAADRTTFERIADRLATRIAGWPRGFVHRDYQSRNLMVVPSRTGNIGARVDRLPGRAARASRLRLRRAALRQLPRVRREFIDERLDEYAEQLGLRRPTELSWARVRFRDRAAQAEGRGAFHLHRSQQRIPRSCPSSSPPSKRRAPRSRGSPTTPTCGRWARCWRASSAREHPMSRVTLARSGIVIGGEVVPALRGQRALLAARPRHWRAALDATKELGVDSSTPTCPGACTRSAPGEAEFGEAIRGATWRVPRSSCTSSGSTPSSAPARTSTPSSPTSASPSAWSGIPSARRARPRQPGDAPDGAVRLPGAELRERGIPRRGRAVVRARRRRARAAALSRRARSCSARSTTRARSTSATGLRPGLPPRRDRPLPRVPAREVRHRRARCVRAYGERAAAFDRVKPPLRFDAETPTISRGTSTGPSSTSTCSPTALERMRGARRAGLDGLPTSHNLTLGTRRRRSTPRASRARSISWGSTTTTAPPRPSA